MKTETILPFINRPSRYIGCELNSVRKGWDETDLHIALAFPDLYEIGMSHLGLQILYRIINNQPAFLAERVYAPGPDMEVHLREANLPLCSLESDRPLRHFDILGITLPYELCYTNILTILDLGGIALRAKDRGDDAPLVIGGGPCAFHPEPVAEFFDAFLLGDGEQAVLEIARLIDRAKQLSWNKSKLLQKLARLDGVYIPCFFEPRYADDGRLADIRPLLEGYSEVKRTVLPDLEAIEGPYPPLVPLTRTVHDRLGIEIARGCTRGCRFCQAGMIYRPVRERSPDYVFKAAQAGIGSGGFDELALLSLSTGDYSCLEEILPRLMNTFADQHVSVSMPSMRVGTLTPEVMEQIRRVRKTGFTLAPEAGTDRLRKVINKGIEEEDLLETCRAAFALGWKLVKFYFMYGLPFETREDFDGIAELVRKALKTTGKGGCKINVSAAVFVPKPHTPFQWAPQLSIAACFDRIDRLKAQLPKSAPLKWNDPRMSYLEGVFSRGDRRLGDLIETAWQMGARLDGWSEHFDLRRWQEAAKRCNVNMDWYLRERGLNEVLPWQHLHCGVSEDFLRLELARAAEGNYTADCRYHGCKKCGLCDFKSVQPVVNTSGQPGKPSTPVVPSQPAASQDSAVVTPIKYTYRISYARKGRLRFLGHLEMIQVIFRALQRVGWPVLYSKGFNPSPKVSFSPALAVGMESNCEFFIVELAETLDNPDSAAEKLNEHLPEGLQVISIETCQTKMPQQMIADYAIELPESIDEKLVNAFAQKETFPVSLTRKKKPKTMDAKGCILRLEKTGKSTMELSLLQEAGKMGIKPSEVLAHVLNLAPHAVLAARICKTGMTVVPPESQGGTPAD